MNPYEQLGKEAAGGVLSALGRFAKKHPSISLGAAGAAAAPLQLKMLEPIVTQDYRRPAGKTPGDAASALAAATAGDDPEGIASSLASVGVPAGAIKTLMQSRGSPSGSAAVDRLVQKRWSIPELPKYDWHPLAQEGLPITNAVVWGGMANPRMRKQMWRFMNPKKMRKGVGGIHREFSPLKSLAVASIPGAPAAVTTGLDKHRKYTEEKLQRNPDIATIPDKISDIVTTGKSVIDRASDIVNDPNLSKSMDSAFQSLKGLADVGTAAVASPGTQKLVQNPIGAARQFGKDFGLSVGVSTAFSLTGYYMGAKLGMVAARRLIPEKTEDMSYGARISRHDKRQAIATAIGFATSYGGALAGILLTKRLLSNK